MPLVPVPHTQIHQNQAYVIQDPGIGGAISNGLGTVLAALQQSQENKYREEQLGIQRYNASVNSRQQDLADAEAERERLAAGQLGGFLRTYVGGTRGSAPPQPGNQTQMAPGAGITIPQYGNQVQTGPGVVASRSPMRSNLPPGVQGTVPSGPGNANGVSSTTTDPANGPATQGVFQQMFSGAASALNPAGLDIHMQAALLGVSPENLPTAIAAAEKVQGLAPKQPNEPTTDIQNFREFLRVAGIPENDPRVPGLLWTLIGPKPGTTVNVGGKPSAFDEKWGENQALALAKTKDGANVSLGMFETLHEAYGLVKKGQVITGFGAKQILGLARFARAMGAPVPDDFKPLGKNAIADTQTMLRLAGDQVLAYLRSRDLGSGTAVSDNDRLFMESMAGRDITLDKTTLERIMRINVGVGLMKAEEAIRELREQARQNPGSTAKLNADAAVLERRLGPQQKAYLQMKASELKDEEDIKKRAASLPGFVQ